MPKWTPEREKKLIRGPDGKFRDWIGGYELEDLEDKEQNYHGIQTHIGIQFKNQTGRKAKIGDITRDKNKDGSYHKGASWYIKTRHGWRKSPTGTRKPSRKVINRVNRNAREGRRDTTIAKDRRNLSRKTDIFGLRIDKGRPTKADPFGVHTMNTKILDNLEKKLKGFLTR